eukprot:4715925-Prymnesium_polylepis.1
MSTAWPMWTANCNLSIRSRCDSRTTTRPLAPSRACSPFASMALTHLCAVDCGSMKKGQRPVTETTTPLSTETSSAGRPCSAHFRSVTGLASRPASEKEDTLTMGSPFDTQSCRHCSMACWRASRVSGPRYVTKAAARSMSPRSPLARGPSARSDSSHRNFSSERSSINFWPTRICASHFSYFFLQTDCTSPL